MHCSKVVHKDFIMTVQRFTQILSLVNEFILLLLYDRSKLDNKFSSVSIHLHCLLLPRDADLLQGDKKPPKTTRCDDWLFVLSAADLGTSGGHEDTNTAEAWRVRDCRYKVLSPLFSEKSGRGQCRWSLVMGGTLCRHGDKAAADNWAWDSVATKQHGLGNEINDVVLGLVSPRRGLSPNSLPKVKERTITQTQIHQAHSLFRLSSKWCFRAGSGFIPTHTKKAIYSKSQQ